MSALRPMDAAIVEEIPEGPEWQYEPKWDGFRCLASRDVDTVELQSKSGEPLARYFPEIVAALLELKPKHFLLDGEIVIATKDGFSFDALLQRIHPAASRIEKLSHETPATFIVFDLLTDDLLHLPLADRRQKLEEFAAKYIKKDDAFLQLSPATTDVKQARAWLKSAGAKLDGVIAKRLDLPYQSGNREGMVKVKKLRTADCVIGGFRYATKGKVVGSLLLGMYDKAGLLHHVGFCSGIPAAEKKSLTAKLEKLIEPPGFTGRAPGGPSRWSTERTTQWEPLKPVLVVEVQYDHFTKERFRHGTRLLRWRPDKAPHQCLLPKAMSST
jgi:ATP-dependent DNA ligase